MGARPARAAEDGLLDERPGVERAPGPRKVEVVDRCPVDGEQNLPALRVAQVELAGTLACLDGERSDAIRPRRHAVADRA